MTQDTRYLRQLEVELLAQGWSQSGGWRSYQDWKRWYRQHWGGLQAWRGVYRAFSEPEGIQAEVEIVVGHQTTTVGDEAGVRRRARASLLRSRDLIARDPRHLSDPVVVIQVWSTPIPAGRASAAASGLRRPPLHVGRWASLLPLPWRN